MGQNTGIKKENWHVLSIPGRFLGPGKKKPDAKKAARAHSLKTRTSDRTGEAIGSGFHWSDHWFTGSISDFYDIK
jgi:hypothetical protein